MLAQSDDRAHDHADAQNNGGHGTIRGEPVQERLHDGVEQHEGQHGHRGEADRIRHFNWLVHDGAGAGDADGHFQSRHQIAGDKECESSEDLVVALMGTMPFIQ